jgi:hypothetical protein
MASRPAHPSAQPGGPVVVASSQRTPAGGGVAVALATVSTVDSSGPDTRAWFRKQQRTADAGVSGSADSRTPAGPGVHGGLRPAAAQAGRAPCLLVCAVDQDRRRGRRTPEVRIGGQLARPVDTARPDARCCGPPAGAAGGMGPLRQRPAGQLAAEPSTSTAPMAMLAAVGPPNTGQPISSGRVAVCEEPDRQIRSLGAAGKLASSCKGKAG